MAVTLDDIHSKVIDLRRTVEDLPRTLLVRAGQIVIYSGLSDISESLGIIRAGEFRAGNRSDPNGGFSGMRMVYPPVVYNNDWWNLVGVENDVLQFGVRAIDGKLVAGGGSVVLDTSGITAIAGNIAGWQIEQARLTNTNISLYSSGSLQTNDFTSGVLGKGWRISSDGAAEFNNAFVRGELRTTVLTYQEVQAVGGTLAIFKSAGSLRSQVSVTSGSFTIDVNDPPSGHMAIFSVGDRLRIKTGTYDSWFNVTAVTDMTTYYRYTCTYVSGSATTYEAGTAVINYGQSGQGLIEISTIGASAPFMKFGIHTGNPHTGITEYLRIGNLQGGWGVQNSRWGIGIGEWGQNKHYMIYTPEEGLYVRGRVIAEGGTVSTFRETFDYDDVSKFQARVFVFPSFAGEISIVSGDGIAGGKVLRCGDNNGNDEVWAVVGQPIPYNPNKLYRMSVRFRRLAGSGRVFCGVGGIRADGVTPINVSGSTSWYSQHYFCAFNYNPPNSDWIEKVGYLSGYSSTTVPQEERPQPNNPLPLRDGARYIVPLFLVNYSGQSGIYDIDEIRIDEVSDTITADRIYSGSLTVGTKLTIGQVANEKGRLELEAQSDGTGTLKGIYRDASGIDTTQAYFGSDGKFYAGGGVVVLDKDGFSIRSNEDYRPEQSLKFLNSNLDTQFEIYSVEDPTFYGNALVIESNLPDNSIFWMSLASRFTRVYLRGVALIPYIYSTHVFNMSTSVNETSLLSNSFNIFTHSQNGLSSLPTYTIRVFTNEIFSDYNSFYIYRYVSKEGIPSTSYSFIIEEINYKLVGKFTSYLIGKGGLLLSSAGSTLSQEHTLTLENRTTHPSTISNHLSLYNYEQGLTVKTGSGHNLSVSTNTTLLMPLQFSALRALWFFQTGYINGTYYDAIDVSPNHLAMTKTGTLPWTSRTHSVKGGIYQVLSADGSTAYFSRTCNGGLQSNNWFQFGCWVYLSNTNRNHGIVRAGTTVPAWQILYYKPAGNGYFESYVSCSGGQTIYNQVTMTTPGWHFVGFRYYWVSTSNWASQLFIDGTYYIKDYSNSGSRNQMLTPEGDFEVGRVGTSFYLQGSIPTAFYCNSGISEELPEYYQATRHLFVGTTL